MNTLNGLKKLLAKLGGNPDAVNNNGDAVDAIAEAYADHVGAVIDDTKASEDTVYSSSKVESIVPKVTYIKASYDLIDGGLFSIKQGEKYTKPSEIINAIKNGEVIKFVASGMSYTFDSYTGIIFDAATTNDTSTTSAQIKVIAIDHFKTNKTTIHHALIAYSTNAIANIPISKVEINDPT